MKHYFLPERVNVYFDAGDTHSCTRYALSELLRILQAMHCTGEAVPVKGFGCRFALGKKAKISLSGIRFDGWKSVITPEGAVLAAKQPKGLLNGVYALAEDLGVLFLEPGPDGEWFPEKPVPLAAGTETHTPRFPWRGTCFLTDESVTQWMIFHAKLKFNGAFIADERNFEAAAQLAEKLGMRLELGQHGFRQLLPREEFSDHPERFRMVQPDDFGGKRQNDYNCCITHPETRKTIAGSFREKLRRMPHAYGVHCWPDDLPGSGWCMCPNCRSMTPSDQALNAMNLLGEAVRKLYPDTKVAFLAYHDTMFPGSMIHPSDRTFLVFAPRERCYAHALDDPRCDRNRHYLQALLAWEKRYEKVPDRHTYEYYFDQILFRGLYFFLPQLILDDMNVYEAHGIDSHFALQAASVSCAPDYNFTVFSRGMWDAGATAAGTIEFLARRIMPDNPAPLKKYLTSRAAAFRRAAETCGHDLEIYLDYRWLPETSLPFGKRSAENFKAASLLLEKAAQKLEETARSATGRLQTLLSREIRRAQFEAAELAGMAIQQTGLNALGKYHDRGRDEDRKRAVSCFRAAVRQFQISRCKAEQIGIPPDNWYFRNINTWQSRELTEKADRYDFEAPKRR